MTDHTERPLRLECAWCGRLIEAGQLPTSHGICRRCADREVANWPGTSGADGRAAPPSHGQPDA